MKPENKLLLGKEVSSSLTQELNKTITGTSVLGIEQSTSNKD